MGELTNGTPATPAGDAPPPAVVDAIAQAIGDAKARWIRSLLSVGIPMAGTFLANKCGLHVPGMGSLDNPVAEMLVSTVIVGPLLQALGKWGRNKGIIPPWMPLVLALGLLGGTNAAADTSTFTRTATNTNTATSTNTTTATMTSTATVTPTATVTATVTTTATSTLTGTVTSTATCAVGCYGYVTNAGSNYLSIFDAEHNSAMSRLFVGLKAFYVAVAPDGSRAYVTLDGSPGALKVLDISGPAGTDATVVQGMTLGNQPRFVAVNTAGTIQGISNFNLDNASTVSVVGPGNQKIDAGAGPFGCAISPNGSILYVANHNRGAGSKITKVNLATRASSSINVGAGPRFVAFTPNGSRAYVSNEMSGTVSAIDPATSTVAHTITVGSKPWYVLTTADGSFAYVVLNKVSGAVVKIDTSTDTVAATIAVGSYPQFAALTPDDEFLYVANVSSGTVSVVNVDTDAVDATVTVGDRPLHVAVNQRGDFAYVTRNLSPGYVNVIATASNTVAATIAVGAYPVFIGVRPF